MKKLYQAVGAATLGGLSLAGVLFGGVYIHAMVAGRARRPDLPVIKAANRYLERVYWEAIHN